MKYLKPFNENLQEPQVGDYVVIKVLNVNCPKDAIEFIESHIGRIKNNFELGENMSFLVKFDKYYTYYNFNKKLISNRYYAQRNEIAKFSPNRINLEQYIAQLKYNL